MCGSPHRRQEDDAHARTGGMSFTRSTHLPPRQQPRRAKTSPPRVLPSPLSTVTFLTVGCSPKARANSMHRCVCRVENETTHCMKFCDAGTKVHTARRLLLYRAVWRSGRCTPVYLLKMALIRIYSIQIEGRPHPETLSYTPASPSFSDEIKKKKSSVKKGEGGVRMHAWCTLISTRGINVFRPKSRRWETARKRGVRFILMRGF